MNAYLDGMRRYADFTGRSTRNEFWYFMLGYVVLSLVGVFIDTASSSGEPTGIVTSLISLAHLLPSWSVSARRLHDIDRSGWWVLIAALLPIGTIVLIVFYCTASKPGANRFGAPVAAPAPGTGFDQYSFRQPDFTGFEPVAAAQPYAVAPNRLPVPVVSTVNAAPPDQGALIERLERLASLRASGTIDDAEFQRMKTKMLTNPT